MSHTFASGLFANEYVSPNGIRYWRVDSDIYGNPRYIVHYISISSERDKGGATGPDAVLARFSAARDRVGGKRYRGKWFGGGIVFQSYLGTSGVGEWLDTLAEEAARDE